MVDTDHSEFGRFLPRFREALGVRVFASDVPQAVGIPKLAQHAPNGRPAKTQARQIVVAFDAGDYDSDLNSFERFEELFGC